MAPLGLTADFNFPSGSAGTKGGMTYRDQRGRPVEPSHVM